MPKLKIDGRDVEVARGETVMQAAVKLGVHVPHFCWHPGLSIAANCRMCLVDGKNARGAYPKLVPACQWPAEDGSEIFTDNETVRDARQGVLEFLFLNHPIDCPICDKAGECKLQDYYQEHGLYETRNDGAKVKKPKVQDIGREIVFDAERCVLCTRCVRFCQEVTKTGELTDEQRSDHAEITIFPGKRLDNAYSLNTVDICPVGALTSKDFRFQQRAWFLKQRAGVCPGCARGCNVWVDVSRQDDRAYRLRPRVNLDVNQWWMCDEGRYEYKRLDEGRVAAPQLKAEGRLVEASWTDALGRAADRLNRLLESGPEGRAALGLVVSAQVTSEDAFALVRLAREFMGIAAPRVYVGGKPDGEADTLLRVADKNPNRRGVAAAVRAAAPGVEPGTAEALLADVARGAVRAVLVLGDDLGGAGAAMADQTLFEALEDLDLVVVLGTNERAWHAAAHVVLPLAAWAECDGTFVNGDGREQRVAAARRPQGQARQGWDALCKLGQRMGYRMAYRSAEVVRLDMAGGAGGAGAAGVAGGAAGAAGAGA
ncbi:MAG TPA: molybdopterin-dependent oxidoreductase [Myxococcota bacterium]|nr:molybdopterin-dependent oxidoreductase [Myxococcota bacterium]